MKKRNNKPTPYNQPTHTETKNRPQLRRVIIGNKESNQTLEQPSPLGVCFLGVLIGRETLGPSEGQKTGHGRFTNIFRISLKGKKSGFDFDAGDSQRFGIDCLILFW